MTMAVQPPADQQGPSETKVILRSLNFTRASEAQRKALGVGGGQLIELRMFYGPVIVEAVKLGADGNTTVDFGIRIRMEGDFLTFDASFEGYLLYVGALPEGQGEAELRKATANSVASYIQEIVAYVTGRSGISPLIPPLGGEMLRIEAEKEQA